MNKLAIFVVVLLAIGAYFYRDQWLSPEVKNKPASVIYRWKDSAGKTHYSSDKSAAPANAKAADLPEISIVKTDKTELEKQAKRLKEKDAPVASAEAEKPKLPQVRNLALERMEKAAENLKK
jgi:Domain of unknown function (DUF4124)